MSISSNSTPGGRFEALPVERSSHPRTTHIIAPGQQPVDDMRANEAGPPVTITRIRHPQSIASHGEV